MAVPAEVFAIEPEKAPPPAHAPRVNPFHHTARATLNGSVAGPAGIELFTGKGTRLQALHEPRSGRRLYLWGRAAHPDLRGEALLRWCLDVLVGGRFAEFTRLVG